VNCSGTAVLLQTVTSSRRIERLVVASSTSSYGEGLCRNSRGEIREAAERSIKRLKTGDGELYDNDGDLLVPVPTPDEKSPQLASLYALSKYTQERMCLMIGRAYGIDTVALRFFNAYGPFQALSNPYTGVLSNFASRVLNGRPPLIFEDGLQETRLRQRVRRCSRMSPGIGETACGRLCDQYLIG
jgi:dTDP-L-rhamnose 4-epimerase